LYAVDAAMMYLSKGGFNFRSLQTIGLMTKEKYLKQLQEIAKQANGKKDKNQVDITHE
jgi:hypothetical protein